MSYEFFEIDKHGQTATLWLNRPEKRNAMGPAFWNELPRVMSALDGDPEVRAVVIAGRGRDFTVGLDLKAMSGTLFAAQPSGRFALIDEISRLQRSITSVAECRKPVIAAVHGYCLGGGIDLITACDIRYASRDTIFSIRETKIAIVADVGTLQRLPAIIGKGHVAELAYSGDDIGAERAEAIHLVNRVYADAGATLAAARDLAGRIAANSPLAVVGTKRVLEYGEGKSVEDGLQYVATWNSAFLNSDDLREAMAAFLEKRKPNFTGR
ncbi:MAG: crotonase/enoyl-CoA hydratase family protein [Deltaproteobacteria bacterium]|nr:crotonase/enoyl-CoA hydratase family protein [Deltaproteobacteria bacterium]